MNVKNIALWSVLGGAFVIYSAIHSAEQTEHRKAATWEQAQAERQQAAAKAAAREARKANSTADLRRLLVGAWYFQDDTGVSSGIPTMVSRFSFQANGKAEACTAAVTERVWSCRKPVAYHIEQSRYIDSGEPYYSVTLQGYSWSFIADQGKALDSLYVSYLKRSAHQRADGLLGLK